MLTPTSARDAPPPDDELVQLARVGDEAAFAALVGRHRRGVHVLARRFLEDEADAEDAAQETFARAFARLHTYRPAGRFGSWLLAICAHRCLDELRARRRRVATVALGPQPDGAWFISAEAGPEERAVRRTVRAEVRGWLAALPTDYRAVLALRYERGYSYKEIAAALDLPLATVRMRLHRAHRAAHARARERR